MAKDFTAEDVAALYTERDHIRKKAIASTYGEIPYANYGYWPRDGMTIEEAGDAMTELMAAELELGPDDELLECGCGYGASALFLLGRFQPKRYVGLDVTEVRIREARRFLEQHGYTKNVEIRTGDAIAMDFADESFTKILAIECVFHFNTRADFFREAFRVLRPGGILAITDITLALDIDYSNYTPDRLHDILQSDWKHIPQANVYDAATYERLLREPGFDPISIYSIKDRVLRQFAAHLEVVAKESPPEDRARRLKIAGDLRDKLMAEGDYIVVRAQKGFARD